MEAIVLPATAIVDYSWLPDTFLTCYTCFDPTAEPPNTTTFTITVTNQSGCVASDDVTVFLVKNRPIYIPNAFTPNGDGTNDYFTLYGGKSARKIQLLRIFNRWGALIFEGQDLDLGDVSQGWDGTFKGERLQPDVFAFYALIEFIDDEIILFEGDLTILK
jgi:gliding motility-associated-like protein